MSQLRLNPLTGRWVTDRGRAGHPAGRPDLPPAHGRGRPGAPAARSARATRRPRRPRSRPTGPTASWLVRVVPNLFPAFEGSEPMRVQNLGPVFTQAEASGVHEVLVFTPEHHGSWADLDDKQAGLAMAAIRDRMEDHARRSTVRYTQAIVNTGREAGASLDHPHGQLLGIPFVPGEIAEEEAGFQRFEGSCLLCTMLEAEVRAGHRTVRGGRARRRGLPVLERHRPTRCSWCPAPTRSTSRAPRRPTSWRWAVRCATRCGCSRPRWATSPTTSCSTRRPHHHEGPFHWHVHIVPRLTSLAGFEQGTGRADQHHRPRARRPAPHRPLTPQSCFPAPVVASLLGLRRCVRTGRQSRPAPAPPSPGHRRLTATAAA